MGRDSTINLIAAPLITLGLGLPACSTTETESICVWVYTKDECKDEAGGDEVGEGSDAPPLETACISAPDGTTRTLHQCHGELTGTLSFVALGKNCPEALGSEEACQELHHFGSEPYELTRVMACCDPLDDESSFDEYLTFCAADLAQQICRSVSLRIEHMINDGELPKTAESIAIQKWIATHQEDCFKAFWEDNMASEPGALAGSWSIPNKAAWKTVIKDFTVTVDSAIDDVTLPGEPADHLGCTDSTYNDTEILKSQAPWSPGIAQDVTLNSAVPLSLSGPLVAGGLVKSTETLASLADDCEMPWCSSSAFRIDLPSGAWVLEDMNLFVNGTAMVGNANGGLAVERASLRLYETTIGTVSMNANGTPIYRIQPRQAHFVLSGTSAMGVGLYLLSNASTIMARPSGSGWVFDEFVLDYEDARGETWTLNLPRTDWQ